jgi:ketosteroid isomerase-like protein
MAATAARPATTHRVVEAFARAWANPSLDGFLDLFTEDVHLSAPLTEPSVGLGRAYEEFSRLLYVWPDVRGVVDRASAHGDTVFIEWRLLGRFAGRDQSFRVVDRIITRDGKIAEREMFGDGLAIAQAFLRFPTKWPRIWRSGLAPTRSMRRVMRATTSRRRFHTGPEVAG